MKRLVFALATAAAALVPSLAFPCGSPFGSDAGPAFMPAQDIFIRHSAGTETYVFQPRFCGMAKDFGLVLPVPAPLSANPTLVAPALFEELHRLSAPTVQHEKRCRDRGPADSGLGGSNGDAGVTTIEKGTVGIFDWSLLQATSKDAFTQWLDTNGYVHGAAADTAFQHYVDKSWYFVAFKVSTSASAPPPSAQLCGTFGPISLGFPAPSPVLPARIAQAGPPSAVRWNVFTASSSALEPTPVSGLSATREFSGALDATALATAPELAKLASPGETLARHELFFVPASLGEDIPLRASSAPSPYRKVVTVYDYVDCPLDDGGPPASQGDAGLSPGEPPARPGPEAAPSGGMAGGGCSVSAGAGAALPLGAVGALAALGALGRRRRRRGV